MSWLLGHAQTKFYHASNTLDLPLHTTSSSSKATTTSLASLCQSSTPPCTLNPFLFNGHLQTFYTAIKSEAVPVHYRRRIFTSTDADYPGSFAVDFATHTEAKEEDKTLHPRVTYYSEQEWRDIGSEDDTPMLIALHGLSGGSHELYLRHVLSPLINEQDCVTGEVNQKKWEALVVNARGCANSKITTPVLFNARATWDVRQVVRWARKTFPNRPLFAVGFSLGGNILSNYVGEEGDQCELKAAVVCSNPWDLHAGSLALQRTWLGREVYSKTMNEGLKGLFFKNVEELQKNPRIDLERVKNTRYIHEFDREVQCACYGYPTEGAYYRDASSTESLLAIRIPFFAIHAEDDPVTPKEGLPFQEIQQTPYAVLCTTSTGGHLSWFELGGGRWFVKPTVNFLRKMAEEVDLDALSEQLKTKNVEESPKGFGGAVFQPIRRKLELPR